MSASPDSSVALLLTIVDDHWSGSGELALMMTLLTQSQDLRSIKARKLTTINT
jgi:hypothetical protein